MNSKQHHASFIIGLSLIIGLGLLGYLLSSAAIKFKSFERTVTVKGLAEREMQADIVIWPIEFTVASNDLNDLYQQIDHKKSLIESFLLKAGVKASAISFSTPSISDKSAQQYDQRRAAFRFSAFQNVTVYSKNLNTVFKVMGQLSDLGKQGIVFTGNQYQTDYLFTRLSEIKPGMVEEATLKAREVAEKFASDSKSQLGKIKHASQGQFSISARDKNNPHIKRIRVVSTVTYYLSD